MYCCRAKVGSSGSPSQQGIRSLLLSSIAILQVAACSPVSIQIVDRGSALGKKANTWSIVPEATMLFLPPKLGISTNQPDTNSLS